MNRNSAELMGRIDETWQFSINGTDAYGPCETHGTEMAEVAAGTTKGVAIGATIHSARVTDTCIDPEPDFGAVAAALEFIADHSPRPAVVNISLTINCFGVFCGQTADDAAKYARNNGITVVVAAGNDDANACGYSPAHVTELLTVGSAFHDTDTRSQHSTWASNWGNCVDLFAPMHASGGTSSAAALVTGVAALHLQLYPGATPHSVETAILSKATVNVLDPFTLGLYSPNRLLYSRQPELIIGIDGPTSVGPGTYCTWNAHYTGGQPNYQIRWYRDGVLQPPSGTAYDVGPAGSSSFQLQATVTDGVGRIKTASISVDIDPNSQEIICSS